jgi:hypothetical protein
MHIAGRNFWVSLLVATAVVHRVVHAQECVLSMSSLDLGEGEMILYNGYDETAGTVTFRIVYEGLAWIGFGRSDIGEMVGGEVVIGLPADRDTAKYQLTEQSQTGVNKMEAQTLISPNIEQNETHTILTYTKWLEEDGELSISPTDKQTWIWAYGFDNTLSGHAKSGPVTFELNPCSAGGGDDGGDGGESTTSAPAPANNNKNDKEEGESPTTADPPAPPSAPTETPPAAAPSEQSSSSTNIASTMMIGTASLALALLHSL